MSKEVTDLLGKLNGNLNALAGMEAKISPPPPPPPPTTAQAEAQMLNPVPPVRPKREDYEFTKRLIAEAKAICGDLEAQLDRETQTPQPQQTVDPSPHPAASSHTSSTQKEAEDRSKK
jgi:hypothetical protein